MRPILLSLVLCGCLFGAEDKTAKENPSESHGKQPGIFGEFALRTNDRVIGMYYPEVGTLTVYVPTKTTPIKKTDILSMRRLDSEPEAKPPSLIAAKTRKSILTYKLTDKMGEWKRYENQMSELDKQAQHFLLEISKREVYMEEAKRFLSEATTEAEKAALTNMQAASEASLKSLHAAQAELVLMRAAVDARHAAVKTEIADINQRLQFLADTYKELSAP